MSRFCVTIIATGGDGCERATGLGQIVTGCGRINCPDCLTRLFLELLKGRAGAVIESATFEHNLDGPIIVDDLRTGLRAGTFPEQGAILAAEGQLVEHLQALRDAREEAAQAAEAAARAVGAMPALAAPSSPS